MSQARWSLRRLRTLGLLTPHRGPSESRTNPLMETWAREWKSNLPFCKFQVPITEGKPFPTKTESTKTKQTVKEKRPNKDNPKKQKWKYSLSFGKSQVLMKLSKEFQGHAAQAKFKMAVTKAWGRLSKVKRTELNLFPPLHLFLVVLQ
jgi:hypothetical protein